MSTNIENFVKPIVDFNHAQTNVQKKNNSILKKVFMSICLITVLIPCFAKSFNLGAHTANILEQKINLSDKNTIDTPYYTILSKNNLNKVNINVNGETISVPKQSMVVDDKGKTVYNHL